MRWNSIARSNLDVVLVAATLLAGLGCAGEDTSVREGLYIGDRISFRVEAGEVIAELETDKAIAELEAEIAGVVEALLVAEGTEGVTVGTVLMRIGTGEARPGDATTLNAAGAAAGFASAMSRSDAHRASFSAAELRALRSSRA